MSVDLENFAFSYPHATIKVGDKQFMSISAISFDLPVDRSAVYGTAASPLKRSKGQIGLGEGSMTFADLEEAGLFYDALEENPAGKVFNIDVSFENEAGQTRSYQLLSCALAGFSASFEQGADALSLDVSFDFMRLKIDGREFSTS